MIHDLSVLTVPPLSHTSPVPFMSTAVAAGILASRIVLNMAEVELKTQTGRMVVVMKHRNGETGAGNLAKNLLTTLLSLLMSLSFLPLLSGCDLTQSARTTDTNGHVVNSGGTVSESLHGDESFTVGVRHFDPEWIVVPPRLIGKSMGAIDTDVAFDPYRLDKNDFAGFPSYEYSNPYQGMILAGTECYEVRGYDTDAYLALPFDGNYYLYACSPAEKLCFPQGRGDMKLISRFAGTTEQAYAEAFFQSTFWNSSYIVLDILGVESVDTGDLIALIDEQCDQRGITLLIATFTTIDEKGYLYHDEEAPGYWSFPDGLFVDLGSCTIDGDSIIIRTGFMIADLFGQGWDYRFEKENGIWVVADGWMAWIS